MRFAKIALVAMFFTGCGGSGAKEIADLFSPDLAGDMEQVPDLQSTLDLSSPPTGSNVAKITVENFSYPNNPTTSVKICAPGTTNCVTIDNVTIDTGSVGAKFLASTIPDALLSALKNDADATGKPTGECYEYGGGVTWGSVHKIDFTVGGETAENMSVAIIEDPSLPTVPAGCSAEGAAAVNGLAGTNGIIGIGLYAADCGDACANIKFVGETEPSYWDCTDSSNCTPKVMAVSDQLPNPVTKFPVDNNGTIIELPAIPPGGAPMQTGYLVFGIDTQANNKLGEAEVYHLGPQNTFSSFTIDFNGSTYTNAIFDSGTFYYAFSDASIPTFQSGNFTGFSDPPTELTFTGEATDVANGKHAVAFQVGSPDQTAETFDDLASTSTNNTDYFILGLPYFFGKKMYTAIEGGTTSAGAGPFHAH